MKKKNKWLTLLKEKKPGMIVLLVIALFNVVFMAIFSLIVSLMKPMPYFEAMFNCLAMMLDPGCISGVVDGTGQAVLCVICFIIVLFGLIAFTGAVIGYVSNFISSFIEDANNGKNKLDIDGHAIILNWNDRGIEIVNEYMLLEQKNVVVIFSANEREYVQKQIDDSLSLLLNTKKIKVKPTIIVRSGNVFATQQLKDISIEKAKTIIILEEDFSDNQIDEDENGQTIKTLMQVADITTKSKEGYKQKIVVEVNNKWTESVVQEIISCKKSDFVEIIPVPVNQLFGHIFTQFSIMPQLNSVYSELFSNNGVEFFTEQTTYKNEKDFFISYIENHSHSIPLTVREYKGKNYAFFLSEDISSLKTTIATKPQLYNIDLKTPFVLKKRNVIILGHNKNSPKILEGLKQFNDEWKTDNEDIVSVLILDDGENIKKQHSYSEYPFIEACIPADIHDKEFISNQLCEHFTGNRTTVLILSSESVDQKGKDLDALANLIYLQSALNKKNSLKATHNSKEQTEKTLDIVVEIINPEHHDIVQNYNNSNVVISNRYISKILMQLADKDALYDFYIDILTFDDGDMEGKEIYIKPCKTYLNTLPPKMIVRDFIYSLYISTLNINGKGEVAIGYINEDKKVILFTNLCDTEIELNSDCKLIILSDH